MELRLNLLDTFTAAGSDGARYKVCAYDRLTQDPSLGGDGQEHWTSTGQAEYRLEDGRRVEVSGSGAMRIAGSGVELRPDGARTH